MTASDSPRRPFEPDELPYLLALGAELERQRRAAGLTQAQLAEAVDMNPVSISRLERGTRRTRRSTLERIAAEFIVAPIVAAAPPGDYLEDLDPAEEEAAIEALTDHLCAVAGPALAPESPYADRIERRRRRRVRRKLRGDRRDFLLAHKMALPMAKRMLAARLAMGRWPEPPEPPPDPWG